MHHAHIYQPQLLQVKLQRARQRAVDVRSELVALQRELLDLQQMREQEDIEAADAAAEADAEWEAAMEEGRRKRGKQQRGKRGNGKSHGNGANRQGRAGGGGGGGRRGAGGALDPTAAVAAAGGVSAPTASAAVDEALDRQLMRRFMVESLTGYRRIVADRTIFLPEQQHRRRQRRSRWHYISVLLLPLYLLLAMGVVFYWGLALPSGLPAWLWLGSVLYALLVEYVLIQPLRVWALHVWMPSTAKKDLMALHWVLQTRARSLLSRTRGLVGPGSGINALVQHFPPRLPCSASPAVSACVTTVDDTGR